MGPELSVYLPYLAALALGWFLRHQGVLAPAKPATPNDPAKPQPSPLSPGSILDELRALLLLALQRQNAPQTVSTITPPAADGSTPQAVTIQAPSGHIIRV